MKKTLLRISNILLYFLFCGLAGTGLLLEYKTPLDEKERARLLGIRGEDWGEVHLWLGFAVIALVVFHLVLNWKWMSKVALGDRFWPSVVTIAVGILMVIGLLFVPTQDGKDGSNGDGYEQEEEH